jgi:phenylacetate-CoA ligase
MYGSAETGIWAWSNCTKNPSLFSVINGIIVEILNPDTNGYGTIAVTNTFRKRFPVFRYAIGDLGRWVNVQGKSFLELKSRETKSFIIGEQHYDLDEFISLTNGSTTFQIQLSTDENFKEIIRMLIVQNVSKNQMQDFLQEKCAALKRLLNYNERFMEVEVLLVTAADLYIDPNTTKTPVLWDRR